MTTETDYISFSEPYREKAALRPITGPYKDGAKEVRRLLGWEVGSRRPFLSTRAAQNKTNISNGTISTMANGGRVSADTLEIFASRVGGDVHDLKRRFGHEFAPDPDPLSRIGPDVDVSSIAGIPMSPFLASAGDGTVVGEGTADYDTLESILPGAVRAIRVTGDCMSPLYADGDVVFVRQQGNAENGHKVIAEVDGDKLMCKVFRTNGEPYLEPVNGERKIAASRFRVIGVIVGVFRRQ